MDQEYKLLFGKLLGEMYRIQKRLGAGVCPADDATIYALLNGIEPVVDEQVEDVGFVSKAQFDQVSKVLNEIWQDPAKLAAFTGFYDIEDKLGKGGVDRGTAVRVLRFFKANDQFAELIAKMDSSNSPAECRTFKLGEFDA